MLEITFKGKGKRKKKKMPFHVTAERERGRESIYTPGRCSSAGHLRSCLITPLSPFPPGAVSSQLALEEHWGQGFRWMDSRDHRQGHLLLSSPALHALEN